MPVPIPPLHSLKASWSTTATAPHWPVASVARQTEKPRFLISVYSLWPSTQSHSYSFKLPPFSSSLVDFSPLLIPPKILPLDSTSVSNPA